MKKSMENYSAKMQPLFEQVGRLTMIQRVIIAVVVFALLIAAFVFLSIKPQYEKIAQVEKEISETNEKLKIAKKKAAELDKWKEEWAKMQAEFQTVMQALPDKQEIPSLLSDISAAGRNSGLIFNRFSPQGEKIKDFYAEIPVAISISGTYDRLKLFFSKITEMDRVVNIKNIEMSMGGKRGRGARSRKGQSDLVGNIDTQCTAVTYRFLSEEEQKKMAAKKKKKGKKGGKKKTAKKSGH